MEFSPDLPPVEDEEAGVMGLTTVDPSPVDETPAEYREKSYFPDLERQDGVTDEIRGLRRMNTLGLRLGDHGTAWWRRFSVPVISWHLGTSLTC
jgi:hypothetical protein